MFTCDSITRAELDAAPDKLKWASILNAALGNDRRIRCACDGVEFRNVGSTGVLFVVGGRIVDLGAIKDTTVSLAADLSSGAATLRIEGNGRWIQGSLGIGAGFDFQASGAFSADNGFGVASGFAISGPRFLPSGTGPAAPELTADAPAKFRFWDYTDPANPKVVGVAAVSQRDDDIVVEHPQIASVMGDIRVQRVPDGQGIVFGAGGDCYRFAMTMLAVHPGCNQTDPTTPLYQVRIKAAPHGRWPSFPFRKDFNIAEDTLAPQPFKIDLLTADDRVLHTFELYSTQTNGPGTGRAINSQPARQDWTQAPLQPHWTCNMELFWQSGRPAKNPALNHYLPKVDRGALDPRNVTAFDSAPEQWTMITDNHLANGLGAWQVSPKWSRKAGTGFDTDKLDPNWNASQMARDNCITQAIGHGYEPGSPGQHGWYMAPGGSRHDRHGWPHGVVKWASDPDGVRPHGQVPLDDLRDDWMACYANEGMHLYPSTTLEAGVGIPKSKVLGGAICYNDAYYNGGHEDYRADLDNSAVRLLTCSNAQFPNPYRDKHDRLFTGEYARDFMHDYSTAAPGMYLTLSPAHVLEARHSFTSNILCQWEFSQGSFDGASFLTRQHAWYVWQLANMWIAATTDARSFSRAEIEAMWESHFNGVWNACIPEFRAQQTMRSKMWKGFGIGGDRTIDTTKNTYNYALDHDSKSFYFAAVMLLMKQSGSWDAMYARSQKCKEVMDFIVECMKVLTVDCFMDSNGAFDLQNAWDIPGTPLPAGGADAIPDPAWANWPPHPAARDWITNDDGTSRKTNGYLEVYNTAHLRPQMLFVLKRYFPEYDLGRIDDACTKVQGWYDAVQAWVEDGSGNQWHYRFANFGIFDAPEKLGSLS